MSDSEEETTEEAAELPEAGKPLSESEKIFVRLTLWQTVLSVAGVCIAVVALYAALTESAAVRQQTAAGVWPFVQLTIEDFVDADDAGFKVAFTNTGVGPARMRGVRLVVNGTPIVNWAQAVQKLGGEQSDPVSRNFVAGRVLSPNDRVEMISTGEPSLVRRFQSAIANPNTYISYCYCSIFDDCWSADSRKDVQNPEPVDACPDFGDEAFSN